MTRPPLLIDNGEPRTVVGVRGAVVRVRRSRWHRLRLATVMRLRVWWRYGRRDV